MGDEDIDLEDLNHSELVLLAKWVGLTKASRAVPREVLIESILNFEPLPFDNPFNPMRKEMSDWLKRWWDRLQMQAPKAECPNCDLCKDVQALECFEMNKGHFT